jgi:hypothetical protein
VAELPRVFQAVFEQKRTDEFRTVGERNDAAAIKTFRYLRLGMVMVVVALGASVAVQRYNSGCWQGSISAYYYGPARAVFVSGLVAVGVSLMVIKGSTVVEDILLILAGVMAPIVAFVPTSFEASCANDGSVDVANGVAERAGDAQNNLEALIIAGFLALAVGVFVFAKDQRSSDNLANRHVKTRIAVLAVTTVLLIVGSVLLATDRILDYHGWAAVAMFAFLALASLFNGYWLVRLNRAGKPVTSPLWRLYAYSYIAVGALMIVGGLIIKGSGWPNDKHTTLVLEAYEICLFGAMWIIQTFERWGKILQASD